MTGGMMFKGTPGEWEYAGGGRVTTADDELRFIAEAYVDEDAKLISAAPELLKALIEAREIIEAYACERSEDFDFTQIEAAIAKALGEQK